MEELKTWIKEKFAPKLLVVSTGPAKDFCSKFHCTPAQFMQQFCTRTQGFSIRPLASEIHHPFFRLSAVDSLNVPLNAGVLASSAPKVNWQDGQVRGPQDVEAYLSDDPTPWFTAWEANFLEAYSFRTHELVDMPVAIMYIACTHETGEELRRLSEPESLPDQYKSLIYNYRVPRVFLLLHDLSGPVNPQQATQTLESLKQTYKGALCKIQALSIADPEPQLTTGDRSQFSMIFNEIVTRVLSPFVQSTLKEMDVFLDRNKRGFRNAVKGFFKKGGDKADAFTFQLDTMEHTTRYIADLSFQFGDYEVALAHYRSAANDFKGVKAWRHAAASFEMQALCAVLLNGDPREIDYAIDSAYGMYEKSGDQALMVRCALVTFRVLKGLDANKKLVQRLIADAGIIKDFPEVSPLFLEQTALCYLRFRPAHYRKFAFYTILAGDDYRKQKMITHALHCYYVTYPLYKGKDWHHIQLHLEHNLARFAYFLDLPLAGVHFFLSLAGSFQLLSTNEQHQKKVLNELMSTVSKWTTSLLPDDRNPITNEIIEFALDRRPIVDFPLPHFKDISLHLAADDECKRQTSRTSASWSELIREGSASVEAVEECKLHDCAEPLELRKMIMKTKRVCYAGEMLQIHISVKNPLKLTLIIEDLRLLAGFEDGGDGIDVVPLDRVELQQDSQSDLILSVKPLRPGTLVVTGVQWLFGSLLRCRHIFTTSPIRIPTKSQEKQYIPNQCNRVVVQPAQALVTVELAFQSSPTGRQISLLQGQLDTCVFELRNVSELQAREVTLVFKGKRLFADAKVECGDLSPGEKVSKAVMCRGDQLGNSIVRVLLAYRSGEVFRYSRIQIVAEVREAVRAMVRLDHSMKAIDESTLAVCMEPIFPGKLALTQVSSGSSGCISLASAVSSALLYFRIADMGARPDLVLLTHDLLTSEPLNPRQPPYVHFLTQPDKEIVLFWELSSSSRTITGMQSFLPFPKEQLPVHVMLEAPESVIHDFSEQSRLLIPTIFRLKNISPSAISLQLEALAPGQNWPLPLFHWQGQTRKMVSLSAEQTCEWPLTAVITAKGCFDLTRVRMICSQELLPLSFQHFLLVA